MTREANGKQDGEGTCVVWASHLQDEHEWKPWMCLPWKGALQSDDGGRASNLTFEEDKLALAVLVDGVYPGRQAPPENTDEHRVSRHYWIIPNPPKPVVLEENRGQREEAEKSITEVKHDSNLKAGGSNIRFTSYGTASCTVRDV